MRGTKKFLFLILMLSLTLFAAGTLFACGKRKDMAAYTVYITCEEESVLASVEAALQTSDGKIAEGGERRPLTSGKAVFEVQRGNYLAVLFGVPDDYTYLSVTVGEGAPTVSIHLAKKQTPSEPEIKPDPDVKPEPDVDEIKIDEAFDGLWTNARHTLSVDTKGAKITLDGTEADKIQRATAGGYTFTCGGEEFTIFFDGEDGAKLYLKKGDAVDILTFGPYVPPVTLPAGFPANWYRAFANAPALLFDGADFTFEGEESSVTALSTLEDGAFLMEGKLGGSAVIFLWTSGAFTLEMTVGGIPAKLYAEGHVPSSLDAAFGGVWVGDGYEIVIDAEKGFLTLNEIPAKELDICENGYTFLWGKEGSETLYAITMSEEEGVETLLLFEGETLLATLRDAEKFPLLPDELHATFFDGMRSGKSITLDTNARIATVDLGEEGTLSLAIGSFALETGELLLNAEDAAYTFTFDRDAHALLPAEGASGWAALSYFEMGFLPLAEMPASLAGTFVERGEQNGGITFDGPHLCYGDKRADIFAISSDENGGYVLRFDLEGVLGTLLWDPEEEDFAGAKIVLCIGETRTEFYLKDIVGYLDRGLSGSWLGDPVPDGSLEPIRLTLFAGSTKVELQLLPDVTEMGHVTRGESDAFVVSFQKEEFCLTYLEETDRLEDVPSEEETFESLGPFIRYEADFYENDYLPEWASFRYQDLVGRELSFKGGRIVLDGRKGRILHYDAAKESIFAIAVDEKGNAGHVTYTYLPSFMGLEAVPLRSESLQGRFFRMDNALAAQPFLLPRRRRYEI